MDIQPAEISAILKREIQNFGAEAQVSEVGEVLSVGDGIARVHGLDNVQAGEMVEFPGGIKGMALNLETDNVGCVIFGNDSTIKEGDTVKRTGAIVEVPVGKALLGRVVDPLGNPIDGKGEIKGAAERRRVDVKAPGIIPRKSVHEPVQTGLKAIDTLIPIGRGQRIGLFAGTGVGKSVLMGMMARYTAADVIVVGLIGERGREVKEFIEDIIGEQGLARSVVVAAPADAPPLTRMQGANYATAIAEHFRDRGQHVLLLMDSLTRPVPDREHLTTQERQGGRRDARRAPEGPCRRDHRHPPAPVAGCPVQ